MLCDPVSSSNAKGRGVSPAAPAGFVIMAQARLARRHAGRAVRSDTLLSTVKSIQRGDFPTRRAAAARAAPSTPRLVSAARVGPVVYGLLLAFRGDGYG